MKRLILIGSLLTLGACGGGGDSGSSATQSTNPVSTTQPTPPPTSSTPPPDTGSGSTSGDSNICFSGFEVFYCDTIINIGGSGGASGSITLFTSAEGSTGTSEISSTTPGISRSTVETAGASVTGFTTGTGEQPGNSRENRMIAGVALSTKIPVGNSG